jgi:cytochrome P450
VIGVLSQIVAELPMMPQLRWAEKWGGYVCYRTWFFTLRVLVTEPDGIKHILVQNSKNYRKPPLLTKVLRRLIGRSVLSTEGAEHSRQRQGMAPAFHHVKLKSFVPVFNACAQRWTQKYLAAIDAAAAADDDDAGGGGVGVGVHRV